MAARVTRSDPVKWWVLTLVVAAASLLTPLPPWFVDRAYSRTVYPTLQTWLTTSSNLIPMALLDFFLIVAFYLLLRATLHLVSVARQIGIMDALWEAFRRSVRMAAIVTIVFMWCWGFNYRRVPLETVLDGGAAVTPTVEAVQAAVADANALAAKLRGASGKADLSFDHVSASLREPFNEALRQLGRTPLDTPGRPKFSLVLTPFFTWTGVDGMVDPIALESIVHPDLLPFERPFVLGHEWGHLAGQADEAEASTVGWLACMNGDAPLAYSASLYLIMEALAALPADLRAKSTARLDVGVRSDLQAIADRLSREHPTMQRAATKVYNQYLKVNRVDDGTASYGRALSLILSSPVHNALSGYRAAGRAD
jgi:hypothetical protein